MRLDSFLSRFPFVLRRTMEARLQSQRERHVKILREQREALEAKLHRQDNVIRWLRWKVYGGIEPPGHRPISGFKANGAPIFAGPGTPFWRKSNAS